LQAMDPVIDAFSGNMARKRALVQGGAGGLGTFAIQYLKSALNMHVIATSSADSSEFLKSLGADEVIDYTTSNFEDLVHNVDVVFDPLPYLYEKRTFASNVLSPDGHYIHIASSPIETKSLRHDRRSLAIPEAQPSQVAIGIIKQVWHGICRSFGISKRHYHYVFVHPDGERLRRVVALVEQEKVKPIVSRRFSMEQTCEAHSAVENGHNVGKVLIEISSSKEY